MRSNVSYVAKKKKKSRGEKFKSILWMETVLEELGEGQGYLETSLEWVQG
jgi:hypothetical protein